MATSPYAINYDDQRFQQVEADKQAAMAGIDSTYDNMIKQSDQFYDGQINAAKDYAKTQSENQQQRTDFAIEQINQQKDKAEKDYIKEQSGAFVDWQKQSSKYGANAEQMAAQGMTGTGFSESSQVSMFNTYQNRVATARATYNSAVQNYDNAIKDAQLQNNSMLAEIAYNALQVELEMALQGFQHKNTLLTQQMQQKQQTEQTYYNRWRDVLDQQNTENAMEENVRQFNESMAEDKRQFNKSYQLQQAQLKEDKRQFNKTYALQTKNKSSSGSKSGSKYISSSSPKITKPKTKSNGVKSSKGHHSSAIARKKAKK